MYADVPCAPAGTGIGAGTCSTNASAPQTSSDSYLSLKAQKWPGTENCGGAGGGRWLCSVHTSEARWDVPGGPAGPSCRGQLCRESSSSAGRGFARRPSGVPSTPVPALGQHWGSVRAARQPDHGLGGSRDCQEQEAFPRGRQIHAPGRGQPAPRWDVGMGPACGGAPGAQHPHRPGRLSLAHDLSQTDPE